MESCHTVAMGGAGQVAPGPERAEEAHRETEAGPGQEGQLRVLEPRPL